MQPAPPVRVVEITGHPGELDFPNVCAHCGEAASGRILIQKVFERTYTDSPTTYDLVAVKAPFCPRCTARHQNEARRITPFARFLMCFRSGLMISVLGSLFMAGLFGPGALRRLAGGDLTGAAVIGAVAAMFLLIAAGSLRAAYGETQRFAVVEQTAVTRSFDFSRDLSRSFDGTRHRYTLANPRFAEAFVMRNRARIWDPKSPEARKAATTRSVLIYAFVGGGAVLLLWDILKEWAN